MKEKIALITGAGTGLGRELALGLSKQHYHVILVGRRFNPLKELAKEIIAQKRKATPISCDITDSDEVLNLRLHLRDSKLLPVDLVVNNAGIGHFGAIDAMEMEDWDKMFQTNILAPMTITKTFLPYMKEQQSGLFINILSTAALRGKINESGYVATKFALRGFSESLAKEVQADNIRVVRAYMGGMNTPFWEGSSHVSAPSEFRSPKEVAAMILEQMHENDEIIIESKKMST